MIISSASWPAVYHRVTTEYLTLQYLPRTNDNEVLLVILVLSFTGESEPRNTLALGRLALLATLRRSGGLGCCSQ